MFFTRKPAPMPEKGAALPGRDGAIPTADTHFVNGIPLNSRPPEGFEEIVVGMGCFWGVERIFWQLDGVWLTQAGYAGGETPNPTYDETCTGHTGHTEVVRVIYDPSKITTGEILKAFWEGHDPTQGMRQGNDVGSQYRSAVFVTNEDQLKVAAATRDTYQKALDDAGRGQITTEIGLLDEFYHAEDYHQQYLAKNPNGYCGIGGTGVSCPMPTGVSA
ncbi:peptide-methionine (S)-S-oxide reductase MsrA [Henriciella sp. AS95]|uniref:peptide-methionine (S)-S-oxide reductase MsrA n=1 Tax=Henriciella sp. AS95 TaxID=3135782 RepID=UPI00317050F0